ncbi:MAG TPA: hypothetical protein H9722_11880 [Candidatus Mediterraneibacter pullistercoris]|nr:hypothetical protein [Candidatus Mediterraneibacter pullistercoris]
MSAILVSMIRSPFRGYFVLYGGAKNQVNPGTKKAPEGAGNMRISCKDTVDSRAAALLVQ